MTGGASAYTCQISGNEIICTEISDGIIPAGNGVVLYGEPNASVSFSIIESSATLSDNELQATTLQGGGLKEMESGYTYYVLNGSTFKTFTGSEFTPGKAFFAVSSSQSAQERMSIVFNADLTEVPQIETQDAVQKVGKYLIGGHLIIIRDGVRYDANGTAIE